MWTRTFIVSARNSFKPTIATTSQFRRNRSLNYTLFMMNTFDNLYVCTSALFHGGPPMQGDDTTTLVQIIISLTSSAWPSNWRATFRYILFGTRSLVSQILNTPVGSCTQLSPLVRSDTAPPLNHFRSLGLRSIPPHVSTHHLLTVSTAFFTQVTLF